MCACDDVETVIKKLNPAGRAIYSMSIIDVCVHAFA